MVISIDLTTLLAVGSALSLAGAAALWVFRLVDDIKRATPLIVAIEGDPKAEDPKARDGIARRVDDAESTLEDHHRHWRAWHRALRIMPTSDEHEMVEAIRRAIGEGRVAPVETGQHPAIQMPALPPPVPRHQTPLRTPIPREEGEE